jgi:hypothetical protein
METWIPSALALSGWIVTHVLTLRAHRTQFLNSVIDSARKDIVQALRKEQDWLSAAGGSLMGLEFVALREQHGQLDELNSSILWLETAEKLRNVLFADHGNVTMTLEDYENVFFRN